jgi:lipopolysaccharide/colanic/teichoic acid biosynthesis glycosyltransferase
MLKRLVDIVLSSVTLVLLAPLFLVLAVFIKLGSPGPVFFRGVRIGRHGQPFRIYKFRTMVENSEEKGPSSTARDDPRITPVGAFLRKYKLDELPELLNVLKGEMSLVGPRPQVKWAVELYTQEQRTLLTLLPGITDYASLRFPNEEEILAGSKDPDRDYLERIHPEKMRLSLEYVRTRSLWVDMKIILMTVAAILRK